MAGVRKQKAKKLQAAASKVTTTRTRKGRNKGPKISRTDTKKGAGRRSAHTNQH